jgi:cell division protease FtsH
MRVSLLLQIETKVMAENKHNQSKDSRRRLSNNDKEPQVNWRGLLLVVVAIALLGGALLVRGGAFSQSEDISNSRFYQLLKESKIVSTPGRQLSINVEEGRKTETIVGFYRKGPAAGSDHGLQAFQTTAFIAYDGDQLKQALQEAGIKPNIRSQSNALASTLINTVPILLLFIAIYFFFRSQIKMAGKGALSFGKSKARMMARDKNRATFKDVAGIEEAKEDVSELVDFLKDPKKFQKLGGRIPKGVLMVGPPGTGKTLLARAIAGEAEVPFFSISGSDFVEMFVGVGASRVRDMFEQGKKNAPCLMFIDEIDAVGRHRGHGLGGGHDEREQTLNQLLVEMDGFDTQDGVIIIAATNRPDVLDPALLRPGRFDRQVVVSLPDVKGREEILKVHAKKVKLDGNVDLTTLARGTPGYSGAELANVINEAALMAARKGLLAVTMQELEESRDKVRWGKERRSLAMSEREKISTAWHESGHALLNVLLEHTSPLHKVTIIPRGPYLGATMHLPEGDKYSTQQKEATDSLVVMMGGRIAEEMFTNDISNGAAGDIKQATQLTRKMVCEWGMSDLGMVRYSENSDYVFFAREMMRGREYSEDTARQIDSEVKRIIHDAYTRATTVLRKNRRKIKLIASALLEYETLSAVHVNEIIEFGELRNPPVIAPKPPPLPPSPPTSPTPSTPSDNKEQRIPPGGLPAPAPA